VRSRGVRYPDVVRIARFAVTVAIVLASAWAASCDSSDGGAASDAGTCDPQAKPTCPTDCEWDFVAECVGGAWWCPVDESALECDRDAMPRCSGTGIARCSCNSSCGAGIDRCKSWACPDAGREAGAIDAAEDSTDAGTIADVASEADGD
jgi:hypothetical protein